MLRYSRYSTVSEECQSKVEVNNNMHKQQDETKGQIKYTNWYSIHVGLLLCATVFNELFQTHEKTAELSEWEYR